MTLKIVLAINESRELLLRYARKHMNSELILFIIDLEKFKKHNTTERFMALIQDFIMKDSIYELNISHEMKNRIHIEANKDEFYEIEAHVRLLINQHLLIDDFCSFVESEYARDEKEARDKPKTFNFLRRPSLKNV